MKSPKNDILSDGIAHHAGVTAQHETTIGPKHIAVDLTPVLPGGENGGAKIFVLELLHHLARLQPGVQFLLLTHFVSHDELAHMDAPNMRRQMVIGPFKNTLRSRLRFLASKVLAHFPSRYKKKLGEVIFNLNTWLKRGKTKSMLRDQGVDLLFCPFTVPTYAEPGLPVVSTIYDLQYKTYPEFFSAGDLAQRENSFLAACRDASKLVAISDYSRKSAMQHGKLAPDAIQTIHLRMAQRIQRQSANPSDLNRWQLKPQNYFLYPANYWKHKNHEMLLTAFGLLCKTYPDMTVQLVCTGSPGERQDFLIQAAVSMGLAQRVLFLSYLTQDELSVLMAQCRAIVFPSLYEGFGLPVIEAMAMGVPVACSNVTSLPEVAGEAARLFNPAVPTDMMQAMADLMTNDRLRQDLLAKGQQRVAYFSDVQQMANEYWHVFKEQMA